jgi:hypothetical protein
MKTGNFINRFNMDTLKVSKLYALFSCVNFLGKCAGF